MSAVSSLATLSYRKEPTRLTGTGLGTDHLVGLALVHPADGYADESSAWLAFETDMHRDKAKHKLYGEKYPGSFKKLWLEKAEDHARKTGEGVSVSIGRSVRSVCSR